MRECCYDCYEQSSRTKAKVPETSCAYSTTSVEFEMNCFHPCLGSRANGCSSASSACAISPDEGHICNIKDDIDSISG
jgi:hypothetical protein